KVKVECTDRSVNTRWPTFPTASSGTSAHLRMHKGDSLSLSLTLSRSLSLGHSLSVTHSLAPSSAFCRLDAAKAGRPSGTQRSGHSGPLAVNAPKAHLLDRGPSAGGHKGGHQRVPIVHLDRERIARWTRARAFFRPGS